MGCMSIEQVVDKWHRHMAGELPDGLDGLLADDVVFYSPIVFTQQRGKKITRLYLEAAKGSLPGDGDAGPFRSTKQLLDGDLPVLECETTVDGKYVNGGAILR